MLLDETSKYESKTAIVSFLIFCIALDMLTNFSLEILDMYSSPSLFIASFALPFVLFLIGAIVIFTPLPIIMELEC